MRIRWLVLGPLVGLALATAGHVAPAKVPQVKDPAGDAVGAQSGTDIVSVLYTTARRAAGRATSPSSWS